MIGYSTKTNTNINRNVINGIKLRAERIYRNLMNIDYSDSPEIANSVDLLRRILSRQFGELYLYTYRRRLYQLFDVLESEIINRQNTGIVTSYYGRNSGRGGQASTVSGSLGAASKPQKAGISGKKQRNSKDLVKKKIDSGISDYLPYIMLGGTILLLMFTGYKTSKK